MYLALKHSHMILVALSLCALIIRFIWKVVDSRMTDKTWVKASAHTINTLLVLTGIGLMYITKFMPFAPGGEWLTEKLFCVLAYLVLGYVALHRSCGRLFSLFALAGAIGWLFLAASLAVSKTPYY